jgi:hypothetical protein
MAIDFGDDIVTGFYSSNVATETAYQVPGDFALPTGFGTELAHKRILCMIELFRSLMEAVRSTPEAKLIRELMAKMLAEMHFGSTSWDEATMQAQVQAAALHHLSKHVIPSI